jgi:hypothetical protein
MVKQQLIHNVVLLSSRLVRYHHRIRQRQRPRRGHVVVNVRYLVPVKNIFPFQVSTCRPASQQNYRGTQYVSVAVTFDRRRISSCNCTCDSTAYWCSHIVAVCLTRIHSVSLSRGGKVGRGVSAAATAVRPSTCASVSCVSITSTSPASVQPLPLCVYNGETRLCLPTSERRSHREE